MKCCENNEKELFTADDFTNVIKFVLNRSYEEFKEMYNQTGFIGESYIQEKFSKARSSYEFWWCDLDEPTMNKIINYVKEFYAK